jgi:hypothetical protein
MSKKLKNKKVKKILVVSGRRPTVRETAIALNKVSSISNFGPASQEETETFNSQDKSGEYLDKALDISNRLSVSGSRVSQKQFYSYRDSVYNILKQEGKNFNALPGNPFAQFGHSAIKDSPLKNYASELQTFKDMLKQFYPEVFAKVQFMSKDADRKIAASTGQTLNAEEILQGVSSDYIESLKRKRDSGMSLTNAEKKILDAYDWLDNQLRTGAKKKVSQDIGEWLIDNSILIVIVLLLVFIFKKSGS